MSVAIVGAGPSGLASLRAALESGLEPVLFEKSSDLGGIWQPREGAAWNSMRTNLSKYSCMYSDFPYPEGQSDFPRRSEVHNYLQRFSRQHQLEEHIQYNTEVIRIEMGEASQGWRVDIQTSAGVKRSQNFQYVAVCSGFFQEKAVTFDASSYVGEVIHGKDYREPSCFKDKTVAVIGGSFSGTEIAVDLSTTAAKVVHVRERRFWILSRYLADGNHKVPIDLLFYRRRPPPDPTVDQVTINRRKHAWLGQLSTQNHHHALKISEKDYDSPPYVVISDNYLESVEAGKIEIREARAVKAQDNSVLLQDQTAVKVDAIVVCSGFVPKIPFLEQKILETVGYREGDQLQPFLLHETMFHPKLPGMAFVGMYRGPFFGIIELQARWTAMAFKEPEKYHPSAEEMWQGIEKERAIRELLPRPQFPHGDYVNWADRIARRIGVFPSSCSATAVIPSQYRLEGPGASPDVASAIINECEESFFNPNREF